jgi:hypothetical protein
MKKTILILVFGTLLLTGCNKPIPKPPVTEEAAGTCDKACENYALCASYGDDVTAQDVDDAYATCMEECTGWSQENIGCMAKVIVRNPQDCAGVSMCGLKQYQGVMENVEIPD